MAKIVIAGDAIVVTSALKLEDIRTIEKYRPKELDELQVKLGIKSIKSSKSAE